MTPQPNQQKKARRRCSKGAKKNQQAKKLVKFTAKIRERRADDMRARGPDTSRPTAVGPSIELNHSINLGHWKNCSPEIHQFYDSQSGENIYLRVSDEPNVSNPEGIANKGKGVFARRDISKDTRLCPYVGKARRAPCPPDKECQYCLKIDNMTYFCARETNFDIGYLMTYLQDPEYSMTGRINQGACVKAEVPTPPNFGKYFNTVSSKDLLAGTSVNCKFDLVGDGFDVMFIVAARDITAGEELLIDYGDEFVIHE